MERLELSFIEKVFRSKIQHYDEAKYWKRRMKVVDPKCNLPILIKWYYLYY